MLELQPIPQTIQGERFGAPGEIRSNLFHLTIHTERVGDIAYPVHVVKRDENKELFRGTQSHEVIGDGPEEIVLMSGLATAAEDWQRMTTQLFLDLSSVKTITMLDQPSAAPTVRHGDRSQPLNTNSFRESGQVVVKALEQLKENGIINGEQCGVAISTGTAVLTEAAAEKPGLFKTLVLCAPVGMLDRTSEAIVKGAGTGGDVYIKQFFRDLFKKIPEKYLKPKDQRNKIESVGIVRSIPPMDRDAIPVEDQKKIRFGNSMFELVFKVGRKFPRFWQHFTGMWGDANPHVPIVNKDYKKDTELIAKNTTEKARNTLSGKKIIVVMGMDDGAVPPMEFLTREDHQELLLLSDSNKKAERTLELIMKRVKGKFSNNVDTKVILATGNMSGHVGLKTETELFGPIIANVLQPRKPERTWTRESGWQSATP